MVSTHSRPKAAGSNNCIETANSGVSTHSRPKAAGFDDIKIPQVTDVSTHSRPKAAGQQALFLVPTSCRFNTQPPEGGWPGLIFHLYLSTWFQHTAARRRLASFLPMSSEPDGFNTQPPEGGWTSIRRGCWVIKRFQHTAARRRLEVV